MKKIGNLSLFCAKAPFHPWPYFLVFLGAHSILSFGPHNWILKTWIFLLGIFFPFLVGAYNLWTNPQRSPKGPFTEIDSINLPNYFWGLGLGLLLFARFYRLSSIPFWPLSDEGSEAFLSLHQSLDWSWQLLWGVLKCEPLMYWSQGSFFHLFTPSLYSMRLFPTLVSIGTTGLSYWAARQYLSKATSFTIAWLMTFSMWELILARSSMLVIWGPLVECLCLGWLGRWFRLQEQTKWSDLIWLGFFSGLGFYSWTNWIGFWLALTFWLFVHSWAKKKWPAFAIFLIVSFVVLFPLAVAKVESKGLDYTRTLLSWDLGSNFLSYTKTLLWDSSSGFPFSPNWGGMVNPFLDSILTLGLLSLFRPDHKRLLGFALPGLFFTSLPAFLAFGLEPCRTLLSLPLIMVLCVAGLSSLLRFNSKDRNNLALAFFLIISFSLDAFNYLDHYCQQNGPSSNRKWRNIQFFNAYQIVQNITRIDGSVNLFCEFNPDYDNKTLNVACYSLNAVANPSLTVPLPQWTVVITNIQYDRYFLTHFSGLRYKVLKTDDLEPRGTSPLGIFIFPTTSISLEQLGRWKKAEEIFSRIDFEVKNRGKLQSWAGPLEAHGDLLAPTLRDPFLTTIYWEKMGFFKFLDGHFVESGVAYQKAIDLGIPAAHLYHDLGICHQMEGRSKEVEMDLKNEMLLSKRYQ